MAHLQSFLSHHHQLTKMLPGAHLFAEDARPAQHCGRSATSLLLSSNDVLPCPAHGAHLLGCSPAGCLCCHRDLAIGWGFAGLDAMDGYKADTASEHQIGHKQAQQHTERGLPTHRLHNPRDAIAFRLCKGVLALYGTIEGDVQAQCPETNQSA